MPLLIETIHPGSLAERAGIMPKESIISINGMPVRDFLDLEFYASDYELIFRLKNAEGKTRTVTVIRDSMLPLGIEPLAHRQRSCCNNCVFCFIDQMPPGLRSSLYIKDDDYLFSRVFGNYITLTNLGPRDLERIVDQHIDPLYISAHTTNNYLHRAMMRHKNRFDLLETLTWLAQNGISYHVQIVCVPSYNDGDELLRSVRDLLSAKLNTLSIGIVPVGLTRYRDGLEELQPFSKTSAEKLLDDVAKLSRAKRSSIIYCADEFYVLAQRDVPIAEHYNGYPQLENGIGMLRLTMDNFSRAKAALRKTLRTQGKPCLLLCSTAASAWMEQICAGLSTGRGKTITRLQSIRNDFFGPLISVSGLLTYSDIVGQAKPAANDLVLVPANIFNSDGLTLDGYRAVDIKRALGNDLLVVDSFFADWYLV